MKPKITTKITLHMHAADFDDLIASVYGVPSFEFLSDQESSNDQVHCFLVTKGFVSLHSIRDFKQTGVSNFLSYELLIDLANHDIIPEGEYYISVEE